MKRKKILQECHKSITNVPHHLKYNIIADLSLKMLYPTNGEHSSVP